MHNALAVFEKQKCMLDILSTFAAGIYSSSQVMCMGCVHILLFVCIMVISGKDSPEY